MITEKMYSVAIRKRKNINDFFWNNDDFVFQELNIDCQKRYWLADPFLFEKDGKTYVFYEAFDLIMRKGKIGYSIIDENEDKLPLHIILDEPYHLSFPNIFEFKGTIYIMPESCGDRSIKLFRAISFPEKWEEHEILLSNVYACDTIVMQDFFGVSYLIANEMYKGMMPHGNYPSCWVKNVCYKLSEDFSVESAGTLLAEGDCGIRNAGNSFFNKGKLYRIGQNCPNKQYGKGLVLFEVNSIVPYKETLLWIKDYDSFNGHINSINTEKLIGVHTYNFSDHYEIIDFSQIRRLCYTTYALKKIRKWNKNTKLFFVRIINKIYRTVLQ